MLETTFLGHHPETLRLESFDGVTHLQRVDHPVASPLRDGAPTLGWEGDHRLQMYVDLKCDVWVLVRLEWDGEYRVVTVSPTGQQLNEEQVNRLIVRLVGHDTRRGFDVKAAVDANNAALDAEKARVEGDKVDAIADRLGWGLKKDVGYHY